MITINPMEITTPKSKKTRVLEVLFDGQGEEMFPFTIVRMSYSDNECIGIRWNVSEYEWDDEDKFEDIKTCLGMPNSRGYPTFFIMPNELLRVLLNINIDNSNIENICIEIRNRFNTQ